MDLIWNEIVTEEDISNLNNLYGYFEDSKPWGQVPCTFKRALEVLKDCENPFAKE